MCGAAHPQIADKFRFAIKYNLKRVFQGIEGEDKIAKVKHSWWMTRTIGCPDLLDSMPAYDEADTSSVTYVTYYVLSPLIDNQVKPKTCSLSFMTSHFCSSARSPAD